MSQVAGPSHLGGYQAPSNATFCPTPGQGYRLDSPDRHAAPIPIGSPHQTGDTGSRPPVLGEVGPSRSPAVYPITRHHPYPQSRPQKQGWGMNPPPAHSQVKGKGREMPLITMDNGLPTPDTPSRGNCLEVRPNMFRYCALVTWFASFLPRSPDPIVEHLWSPPNTQALIRGIHNHSRL